MGCGKSKHDVVTGNTTTVKKPSEAESVKGKKENESIKRQEKCTCQKTNEVSADVSMNRPETTVENNTNEPEEKEAGGDCGEKVAEETNNKQNLEEKEVITLPSVPQNIVTEETVNEVNESALPVDEQKAEKVDVETVAEEERSMEDKVDSGDVDTPPSKVEEPKPDIETPVTAESEAQELLPTENVETEAAETVEVASTENDDLQVLKEEDKV